jgi:Holliday junction resolvasome RuvABC ATP-dependent DNA helicase subunit
MGHGQENLIPFNELTEDERRELAKKAGEASGVARREKKTLREMVKIFGELKVEGKAARAMEELGIEKNLQTRFMQGVVALFNKANKGDTAAFNAIRDIIGEKPVDKTQVSGGLDANIVVGYVESGHKPVASEAEVEK